MEVHERSAEHPSDLRSYGYGHVYGRLGSSDVGDYTGNEKRRRLYETFNRSHRVL